MKAMYDASSPAMKKKSCAASHTLGSVHGLHPGARINSYTEINCQKLDWLSNLGLIVKVIYFVQECHMVIVQLRMNVKAASNCRIQNSWSIPFLQVPGGDACPTEGYLSLMENAMVQKNNWENSCCSCCCCPPGSTSWEHRTHVYL